MRFLTVVNVLHLPRAPCLSSPLGMCMGCRAAVNIKRVTLYQCSEAYTVQEKTWLEDVLFYVNALHAISICYKILNDKFNMTIKQISCLHFPASSG